MRASSDAPLPFQALLAEHLPRLAGVIGVRGVQSHALAELRLSARPVALRLQHQAQVPAPQRLLGLKLQRLTEQGLRFLQVPLLLEHMAQVGGRDGAPGVEGHRAAQEVLRLSQPRRAPPLPQQVAQVAQRVRVVRPRFERAPVRRLGAREVLLGL